MIFVHTAPRSRVYRGMSFVSQRVGQFTYFDAVLGSPGWSGKRVLDFGGNIGNLLTHGSEIEPRNYWCLDVSRDAVEQGRERYPDAHFIFYDRYSWAFNPTGVRDLPVVDPGVRFDVIVAYSVFTHTSRAEMLDLLAQLRRLLAPGGVIAFTFIDPAYRHARNAEETALGYFDGTNLQWRLEKTRRLNPDADIESMARRAATASWITLVDDATLFTEDDDPDHESSADKRSYLTLCRPERMLSILPDAHVVAPPRAAYPPPISWEMQHCVVC
ncbi:MAG TPA: class I SAM-dependent methyltransferase [Thermoanaerobaculia bacterium]|nr:class I SAM-dependent methyltransferase [Thermoanaerobaculia bacterium]